MLLHSIGFAASFSVLHKRSPHFLCSVTKMIFVHKNVTMWVQTRIDRGEKYCYTVTVRINFPQIAEKDIVYPKKTLIIPKH